MKNNAEAFEVEETNEPAAQGAIDISDNIKEVALLDKATLPAIPDTLTINGVDFNVEQIRKSVAEIEKMKIDGLGDKAGYDAAVEKLKATSKLRTTSEAWRKNVMKPVLKFGKDLKYKIDEGGELCEKAEAHLKKIIKPIDDAVEIARQEKEAEKDRIAEERQKIIISYGGVFNGAGTYDFPHEPAIFILANKLRELSDEDFEKEVVDIKAAWQEEVNRLQKIDEEENAEKNRILELSKTLNQKRTALRLKELRLEGYINQDGLFSKEGEDGTVTMEMVELWEDNDWDTIFAEEEVSDQNITIAQDQEFANDVPVGAHTETVVPVPEGIEGFGLDEVTPEEQPAVEEPEILKAATVQNCTLYFNNSDKPYIEIPFSPKSVIRIYPVEFQEYALPEGTIVKATSTMEGSLILSIVGI